MAQSTGGMAVLLVLYTLFASTTANLAIYQTRVQIRDARLATFVVDGVATVQIGGTDLINYFLECNTTTNNGSGIQWSRQTGSQSIQTSPATYSGLRLSLDMVSYDELGVYTCTDTFTGDSLDINVTDANPAICPVNDMVPTSEGQQASLEVYVSSWPLPTSSQLRWYRPNGAEILDTEPNVQFANSRRTLILRNVQLVDHGRYEVVMTLAAGSTILGTARAGLLLDVQVPPLITTHPANSTTVTEGDGFQLMCTASGNPAPTITWEREDGLPLSITARMTAQSTPTSPLNIVVSTLSVSSSTYNDGGHYRCSATNGIGQRAVSDYSEIIIRPILTLTASSNNQQISFTDVISQSQDSMFTVICLGSGELRWTSSSGVEIPTSQTETLYQTFDRIGERSVLTFTNFSQSQVAEYTCESPLLDINNMPITESVLITSSDPAVFISANNFYVLDGDSVSIEAGVFSSSPPTVRWYLEGELLDISSDPLLSETTQGSMYTLTITMVDSQRVGVYTVEVSRDGETVTDNVTVAFATPPTVRVAQTDVIVTEGDEVRVQCIGEGVGVVTVGWYHDNEPSPLQTGNDLVISSVTSSQTGEYQCRVSNIADTVSQTVQLTVRYRPFSMIQYNQFSSGSSPTLSVRFGERTVAPIFICTSDGYPEPQISWRLSGGRAFPRGIATQDGGSQLVWRRQFEYTDSGSYECVSENELGANVTTLELLVQSPPRITSIYSLIGSDNIIEVPTGFVGVALTCLAFAWPPPLVQWVSNNGALPEGVVSFQSDYGMGTVSAELRFVTEFNSSFNGMYRCEVRADQMTSPIPSSASTRTLVESSVVVPTRMPPVCSISSSEVSFQLRILGTNCIQWTSATRDTINDALKEEILQIIQIGCNCTVTLNVIATSEPITCSTVVNGGAVFRGEIRTESSSLTNNLFCALSTWQYSNPSVNINSQLFTVDSTCPPEVDSLASHECGVSINSNELSIIQIIIIAASIGGGVPLVILILLIVSLIICCCVCRRGRGKWTPNLEPVADMNRMGPYSRTYLRNGPSNQEELTDEIGIPLYSTLNHHTYPPNANAVDEDSPEHLALKLTPSNLSADPLLRRRSDGDSTDGEMHYVPTDSTIDKPAFRTDNDEQLGFPVGGHFPYDSQPNSGTSSRVTSPPQRESSGNVISAINPIPDYEQLDYNFRGSPTRPHSRGSRKMSGASSFSERKFSQSSNSPSVSGGVGPPSTLSYPDKSDVFSTSSNSRSGSVVAQERFGTAYLRSISRSSVDHQSHSPAVSSISRPSDTINEESRRDSNCSEGLPPYSSRPPSSRLTPSSSMLDNSAYGRVDPTPITSEGDQQWYMGASDSSLNVKSRHDPHQLNGRVTIPPYAMIQNSAIPYEPTTLRQSRTEAIKNSVDLSSRFRISVDRKQQTPQPYSDPVQTRASADSINTQSGFSIPPRDAHMITV